MAVPETKKELESFLRTEIPLLEAVQIRVAEYSENGLELTAPLHANRNDKNIAFAGSIAALASVCGWVWVQRTAQLVKPEARVVMAESSIRYTAPIQSRFVARCYPRIDSMDAADTADPVSAATFRTRLAAGGKARVRLEIPVLSDPGDYHERTLCAVVSGLYVAQ